MNKRLIHSIAAFMIAALLVSVTGVALNRHSCLSTGYTGVSVVTNASHGEDPDCPHLKKAHKADDSEKLPPCCAAAARKAHAASEAKACEAKSGLKDYAGSNLSAPGDCCKNFTKVLSIDSTSIVVKQASKLAAPTFIISFIDNFNLRDKTDKLKIYARSVKEAVRAPIVGFIKILRIINPSRQDSKEAA